MRYQLFSCSALPQNQDWIRVLADLSNQVVNLSHLDGRSDQPAKTSLAGLHHARGVREVFHLFSAIFIIAIIYCQYRKIPMRFTVELSQQVASYRYPRLFYPARRERR